MRARPDTPRVSPELEALVELRQVLLALSNELGSQAQFFKAATQSGVLLSESVKLDANGHWTHDFSVPYAAVATTNLSGATVVVAGDGLQADTPDVGPGVFHVPAGGFACHNLLSSVLSLYGAANAVVDVVVYLRPQSPTFGSIADDAALGTFGVGVQVATAGAAAVELLAANSTRRLATVQSLASNTGYARVGLTGVTATSGIIQLAPGQQVRLATGQSLWLIREGTVDVTVLVNEVT